MPDVRGLVSDPEFRSLPKERQRALLQQIGADEGLINAIAPVGYEAAAQGAETIRPATTMERPLTLGGFRGMGGMEGPSPLSLLEALPGVGGTLGAVLGNVPGAALGSASGEAVRQLLRRIAGYVPATGVAQEQLGLDPSSPEAAIASLAAEGGMGAAGEALGGLLSRTAPGLREKGLRTYAKGLAPKGDEAGLLETMKRLRPIEEELPVGTSGRIGRKAGAKAEKAGERVGEVYGEYADVPASYKPAEEVLGAKKEELVETAGKIAKVRDPITGDVSEQWIPPVVRDEKLWEAFNKRAAELRKAETRRGIEGVSPETGEVIEGGPITVGDVFERRKSMGKQVKRQQRKAFQIGAPTSEMTPSIQAGKAERQALSETLHGELPGTTAVPGGKEVDELFNAWSTVKEGEPGSSHFLARWAASRMAPGGSITSTLAGVIANQSMLWRSTGNKTLRGMAAALEAGDKAKFAQILRTLASQAGEPSKEKK